MKRHLTLVLLRVLLAAGIVYALPFSHMKWGEPYPGDGQQAFGMIMIFTVIGMVFALVYFAVGAIVQYCLRWKPPRWTAFFDFALFMLLAGLLAHGGVTARYSGNGEPDAPPNDSPATPVEN